jgi:UDP-glucose:glycoprotein glucosyltransferase
MAGYGVELALKKTDYLVVDDRDTGSHSAPIEASGNEKEVAAGTFQEILGEDPWSELATPLSKFEVMGKSRPKGLGASC